MLVLINGAGELATAVAHRLKVTGFDIVMTDIENPTRLRSTVAFSQAIYDESHIVEGIKATKVKNFFQVVNEISNGAIPILVDEKCNAKQSIKPDILIDTIEVDSCINIRDASVVIKLGAGSVAGVDCHAVVETQRGHFLGRTIYNGSAVGNMNEVNSENKDRIIRATIDGTFKTYLKIGEKIDVGQVIGWIDGKEIKTIVSGVIRGILQSGIKVYKGMECAEVDPICEVEHCYTISEKARAVAGGVLEAIIHFRSHIRNENLFSV